MALSDRIDSIANPTPEDKIKNDAIKLEKFKAELKQKLIAAAIAEVEKIFVSPEFNRVEGIDIRLAYDSDFEITEQTSVLDIAPEPSVEAAPFDGDAYKALIEDMIKRSDKQGEDMYKERWRDIHDASRGIKRINDYEYDAWKDDDYSYKSINKNVDDSVSTGFDKAFIKKLLDDFIKKD